MELVSCFEDFGAKLADIVTIVTRVINFAKVAATDALLSLGLYLGGERKSPL